MRTPLIAGNWKMHKTMQEARMFAQELCEISLDSSVEAVICAPYTTLGALEQALSGSNIGIGAQNVHFADQGAYTGEISCAMLKESGVRYVIIGHSERRAYFAETDASVNQKLHKLIAEQLVPIVCVGETLEQREADETKAVITLQVTRALDGVAKDDMSKAVIAYEPIWAIGTGKTASSAQANEVCALIRALVAEQYGADCAGQVRILYGGSVKPSNIRELMAESDIDGALVGGAALQAMDFAALVNHK